MNHEQCVRKMIARLSSHNLANDASSGTMIHNVEDVDVKVVMKMVFHQLKTLKPQQTRDINKVTKLALLMMYIRYIEIGFARCNVYHNGRRIYFCDVKLKKKITGFFNLIISS